MKPKLLHFTGLVFLALVLGACSRPQTPQEVAEVFWLSVINEDVDDVVEYSTLKDASAYDHFSRDWRGMTPTWGKVVIEEHEASIVTMMQDSPTHTKPPSFETVLVKVGEVWKVDYERTRNSVKGGIVGELIGAFRELGQQLAFGLTASAEEFKGQMTGLMDEFRRMSRKVETQAADAMARHGEALRKRLDELSESIRQALREQDARTSPRDRETLNRLTESLSEGSDNLSEPDLSSLARTGELAIEALQKLETLDARTFGPYRAQWQQWSRQIESDMRDLLEELKREVRESDFRA